MEKLSRLLTEEIEEISEYEIRKICLLVGYHDLVADIALNHRDKEQLFDLIEDETELNHHMKNIFKNRRKSYLNPGRVTAR